jgi:hypothetical protein
MHFAVGDRDGARDAIGRHVGESGVERGEQLRAGIVAGTRGDVGLADFERLVGGELLRICAAAASASARRRGCPCCGE